MAKVKILGSSFTIISDLKTKDLETMKAFKPKTLVLVDPDTKEEVFAVAKGTSASISKYGISFDATSELGFATATLPLPSDLNARAKFDYIKQNYGLSLMQLNMLETQIENATEAFNNTMATIIETISIVE